MTQWDIIRYSADIRLTQMKVIIMAESEIRSRNTHTHEIFKLKLQFLLTPPNQDFKTSGLLGMCVKIQSKELAR